MKKIHAVLVISLMVAGTGLAGPSIVANGSFENGPEISGAFETLTTGATDITGWTVMSASIDYIPSSLWPASDGDKSLDLSGSAAGGIMQDLATEIGQTYIVQFDMAGNPAGGDAIKQMDLVAGSQSQTFAFDTAGYDLTDIGWQPMQWHFVAESDVTTLQFVSLSAGAYGPALDNVAVSPIPAPGALLLGSLGMGLVGWMRRRKAL
jgi:choice-of-anchor C domain-containing protein